MSRPKKDVTFKDVLYALQFGGERLLRTYTQDERQKNCTQYSLSKTGLIVKASVAHQALANPNIVATGDGLFPGHSQQYEWREHA